MHSGVVTLRASASVCVRSRIIVPPFLVCFASLAVVRTIAIELAVQRRVSLAIAFAAHRLLLLLLLQRRIHRYVILFTLKRTRTATIDRLQHRHHTAPFDSAASDAP